MIDVQKAEATFDNMIEIIEKEMIVKGLYATTDVMDYDLYKSGAICGGRRYCAIGTMVVSYGVKSHVKEYGGVTRWQVNPEFDLMTGSARARHYDETLTAIHDALNEAAIQWIKARGGVENVDYGLGVLHTMVEGEEVWMNLGHFSPIESLFESSPYFSNTEQGRHDLIDIIHSAKAAVCGVTA